MSKQVTLTLKSLESAVTELETIKAAISAHAGTQSARLAAARQAVGNFDVKIKGGVKIPATMDYESLVAQIDVLRGLADQQMDEAITAELRKSKDESGASLTALRDSFKSKAEAATALRNVLVTVGVEGADAIVLPTLKGTGKVGSSKVANSKGQQFYRLVNGERRDQPASQNKFSSIAFYFGAAIVGKAGEGDTNNGAGVGSAELGSFLKNAGVDVQAGKAWTYSVSDDFIVGMDVEEVAAE